jgi:hypothetical protein
MCGVCVCVWWMIHLWSSGTDCICVNAIGVCVCFHKCTCSLSLSLSHSLSLPLSLPLSLSLSLPPSLPPSPSPLSLSLSLSLSPSQYQCANNFTHQSRNQREPLVLQESAQHCCRLYRPDKAPFLRQMQRYRGHLVRGRVQRADCRVYCWPLRPPGRARRGQSTLALPSQTLPTTI